MGRISNTLRFGSRVIQYTRNKRKEQVASLRVCNKKKKLYHIKSNWSLLHIVKSYEIYNTDQM